MSENLCCHCYYARVRKDICGIYCTSGFENPDGTCEHYRHYKDRPPKKVKMPDIVRDVEAYRNATVIVSQRLDGETVVSWVRQDNTQEITPDEAIKGVTMV